MGRYVELLYVYCKLRNETTLELKFICAERSIIQALFVSHILAVCTDLLNG